MLTATGTICTGNHEANGHRDSHKWDVYEINGRRYTVCAHKVTPGEDLIGENYCGQLIDVTDGPAQICCGKH